jgi:hypothetical protein
VKAFWRLAMDALELSLDHRGFSQGVDEQSVFSVGTVRSGDINRSSLEGALRVRVSHKFAGYLGPGTRQAASDARSTFRFHARRSP